MALNPVKTYWRHGARACVLFSGDGTFELRLIEGDRLIRESGPSNLAKSVELEERLARLEICCTDLPQMLNRMQRQIAALQAQIDHLTAKLRY